MSDTSRLSLGYRFRIWPTRTCCVPGPKSSWVILKSILSSHCSISRQTNQSLPSMSSIKREASQFRKDLEMTPLNSKIISRVSRRTAISVASLSIRMRMSMQKTMALMTARSSRTKTSEKILKNHKNKTP